MNLIICEVLSDFIKHSGPNEQEINTLDETDHGMQQSSIVTVLTVRSDSMSVFYRSALQWHGFVCSV